jgi:hypothetical protein
MIQILRKKVTQTVPLVIKKEEPLWYAAVYRRVSDKTNVRDK